MHGHTETLQPSLLSIPIAAFTTTIQIPSLLYGCGERSQSPPVSVRTPKWTRRFGKKKKISRLFSCLVIFRYQIF